MPFVVRVRRAVLLFMVLLVSLPAGVRAGSAPGGGFSIVAGTRPALVARGLVPRRGALAATRRLSLAITLASRDPAGLDRMLRAVYDPRSRLFHRYLSPASFEARFGPDPAGVRALRAWLLAQGLTPGPWSGGFILPFTGDVAHIAAAFHTSISLYQFAGGARFAPDSSPVLPSALARSVDTIVGLSQLGPLRSFAHILDVHHARIAVPACGSSCHPTAVGGTSASVGAGQAQRRAQSGPSGGYTPGEVTSAYDFTPIYANGYRGEHMRVALVELAPYQADDVAAYAAQYGIALPAISDVVIPPGNADEQPQVEATLDIEQILAGAPAAAIDIYEAPNDSTGVGQVEAYSQVARAGNVDVLSLEWVNCEPGAVGAPGFIDTQHAIFKQLALQGTTVVSATGDEGAYGCGDQVQQYDTQPAVNLPASDPYVLAVGASDLALTTSGGVGSIVRETAWSCPAAQGADCAARGPIGAGSGGGVSIIFHSGDQYGTDLSWQAGPGVSNSASTGGRQVPDVVISGAFGTSRDHEYSIYYKGAWTVGGGTSAAAPLWAALILLTDQYLEAQGLPRLGWVNPLIYQLGATAPPYPAYHDITSGTNLLFHAGPGWDYASGWGSPDAWNFLRDAVAFEQAAQGIPTATPIATHSQPTMTPTSIPIFAPSATKTPTPSPTRGTQESPVGTIVFPSPTQPVADRRPTRTPARTPTPLCSGSGIANGAFQTGTLACWVAGGTPPPRIAPSTHFKHRFSVQLENGRSGAIGSILSQTFTLAAGMAHPHLHIGFWLARSAGTPHASSSSASRCARPCPRRSAPVPPLLIVRDPRGRVALRVAIVPHRDRAWSGFSAALPARGTRFTLTIQVPPQPAGAREELLIDDVHVSP